MNPIPIPAQAREQGRPSALEGLRRSKSVSREFKNNATQHAADLGCLASLPPSLPPLPTYLLLLTYVEAADADASCASPSPLVARVLLGMTLLCVIATGGLLLIFWHVDQYTCISDETTCRAKQKPSHTQTSTHGSSRRSAVSGESATRRIPGPTV